ncbi:MAG: hypothetical protein EOO24_12100 [Comamonadaceae bacterium]|nr:MAG: hypothetical protein EOO24_12100 [Comamonadaceae bacterium]
MTFRLPLASALGTAATDATSEHVHTDVAALAAHMKRCAHARGPLFALHCGLQSLHSLAAGRIVTLAFLAVLLGATVLSVA